MEELRIMKGKGDNFIEEIKRQTELFIEMTKNYILTYANRKNISIKNRGKYKLINYCTLLNK